MSTTNGLTEAQEERLVMLAEEASEVARAALKIVRHGYQAVDCHNLEYNNAAELNKEINQLLAIRAQMYLEGDMKSAIPNLNQIWRDKLRYTHHQKATK